MYPWVALMQENDILTAVFQLTRAFRLTGELIV